MRCLILAAALLPIAAPAAAQNVEPELDRMARTMGDPVRQEAMARAIGTMTEVLSGQLEAGAPLVVGTERAGAAPRAAPARNLF